MPTTGGGAAYQRLTVPKDDISANARNAANISAANMRQQKALNAQKEAADKIKKERANVLAYKQTKLPDDAFKTTVTGFDSRDDIARHFAGKSIEGFTNEGRLAREAQAKGDYKAYNNHVENQQKILSQFDNFVSNEKYLSEINKHWVDLSREGKVSPVDEEYEQVMQSLANHDFEYILDENNNPHIKALLKDDKGNEYVKEFKASDFVNGKYRPYEKVELYGKDGLINQMLVGFGKKQFDQNTGNYIVTSQVWDKNNEVALQDKLDALTGDKRAMSSLLYQASGNTIKKKGDSEQFGKGDDFTPKDYKLVKDFVSSQVRSQFPEKTSIKYTGAAEKARHNRTVESKGTGSGEIEVETNSEGKPIVINKDLKPNEKFPSETLTSFLIPKAMTLDTEGKNTKINRLYLGNDGELFYSGKKRKLKVTEDKNLNEVKQTTYDNITGNVVTEGISRQFVNPNTNKRFKNAEELKNYLQSKLDNMKEKSSGGMSDQEYQQFLKDNGL